MDSGVKLNSVHGVPIPFLLPLSPLADFALNSNTDGSSNTAAGHQAFYSNTTGYHGTAMGSGALFSNTTGNTNVAYGSDALFSNTTGSDNIALGTNAGYHLTTGGNNIEIGNQGVAGESNVIRIGTPGIQSKAYIAGVQTTKVTGSAVYVTATGELGVLASSERYKTAVASMRSQTGKLWQLRPVTFHLKSDPKGAVQYGLIAEEVAQVYPELVIRDAAGTIEGVRYEELVPILLNELQRLRHTVDEQRSTALKHERKLLEVERLEQELAEVKKTNEAMQVAVAKLVATDGRIAMR